MPVLKSQSSGETPKPRRVREPEIGSKGGPQEPTRKPRAGVQFGPPPAKAMVATEAKPAKPVKAPRAKEKVDPQLISRARELRDRYLERVNDAALMLPAASGKYDVIRTAPRAALPAA